MLEISDAVLVQDDAADRQARKRRSFSGRRLRGLGGSKCSRSKQQDEQETAFTAYYNLFNGPYSLKGPGFNFRLGFELNFTAGGFGLAELGSAATFGHAGASGCVLAVDPVNDVALAYVSNSHANIDMDRWYFRLSAVSNAVFAAATR